MSSNGGAVRLDLQTIAVQLQHTLSPDAAIRRQGTGLVGNSEILQPKVGGIVLMFSHKDYCCERSKFWNLRTVHLRSHVIYHVRVKIKKSTFELTYEKHSYDLGKHQTSSI